MSRPKQLMGMFPGSLQELVTIWGILGLGEEQQTDRTDTIFRLVSDFISGLVEDEKKLCDNVKKSVSSHREQLEVLCSQLGDEFVIDEELPLFEKEKLLRNQLGLLEKEKHTRLKEYRHLSKKESILCDLLAMHKTALLDTSIVPKKREIFELQENVRMLTEEKERRYKKFHHVKQELTTIMEVTECSPETEFERDVICYDNDENFVLSNENLEQVTLILQKFQKRKCDMESEMNELKEKVEALWNRLKMESNERASFLKKYHQCTKSSISALKSEIERCEEMKKQNIGAYVVKLKEEIEDLWQKCCISKEQQQSKFVDDGNYTDELLELFDNEVERLNKYYASTKHIFEKIEKRKDLWELMLILEKKESDPNRFNNRGGNLLQEERQRKRLLKDLPQLEDDILEAIGKYEEDNDEVLLIFGVNFAEFIKEQWDERNRVKENEKLERQKMRTLGLDQTKTPLKRSALSTPTSAPSKLSRTNMAHFSSCISTRTKPSVVATTPVVFRTRRQTAKTSRWVSPRYPNKTTPVKKVLIEKNEIPAVIVTEESTLNATSYSQFATEMNKNERYNCRSSVLLNSKKVLGSKIQHSGVLRRSIGRSSRKSNSSFHSSAKPNISVHNKTARTPVKLTPARGKLLPFLV